MTGSLICINARMRLKAGISVRCRTHHVDLQLIHHLCHSYPIIKRWRNLLSALHGGGDVCQPVMQRRPCRIARLGCEIEKLRLCAVFDQGNVIICTRCGSVAAVEEAALIVTLPPLAKVSQTEKASSAVQAV
jgi:hypothetical protein